MTRALHRAGHCHGSAAHGGSCSPAPAPWEGRHLRNLLAAFGAVLAVAGLLGGCAAPRNVLGTRDNACFRVLPEALAAVHDRGHLAGERYLPPRALIVEVHHVVVPKALENKNTRKIATCLVAFKGHYTVSDVERGWAPKGRAGPIAIVVIRQRDLVLLATVVLDRIPPRLVFAHVFPRLR